ncbi:hypothetical protein BDL97_13G104700 [Sphagnum fallax]|nr:hypothetical protein BDL97_13G104700 [Sphagnum fallax]KAH8944328.1 hypothetical protein BDL97_13G104700 [Sphagnum fallax]
MASTRTGVFVDDYLEYSSSLPAELQRLLSTMRELDERSQNMVAQLREQVKICLMKKREGPEVDETVDKLRQVIESNQTNALRLCTEKVLLAQQIDSHVKRLDEDLISFAEDLKQEGKIPQDEPAILLSATRDDKRKAHFFTPLGKRIDSRLDRERSLEKERDRERERDRDSLIWGHDCMRQ